ncbi:hypothetical protein CSUI_003352, partial [Cystoisospora suis]
LQRWPACVRIGTFYRGLVSLALTNKPGAQGESQYKATLLPRGDSTDPPTLVSWETFPFTLATPNRIWGICLPRYIAPIIMRRGREKPSILKQKGKNFSPFSPSHEVEQSPLANSPYLFCLLSRSHVLLGG